MNQLTLPVYVLIVQRTSLIPKILSRVIAFSSNINGDGRKGWVITLFVCLIVVTSMSSLKLNRSNKLRRRVFWVLFLCLPFPEYTIARHCTFRLSFRGIQSRIVTSNNFLYICFLCIAILVFAKKKLLKIIFHTNFNENRKFNCSQNNLIKLF